MKATPSLISLRAFEAAARLGSFKAAADALSVSPTAVSHHIRGLEDGLGAPLFTRQTRAVSLTDTGKQLAARLTIAFTEIADALDDIHAMEHVLTVSTTPAFAALWLVPRMEAFHEAHPEISLRLETGTARIDLARDRRVDIAIRYGMEPGPMVMQSLPQERVGLYGAPDYVTGLNGSLSGATLLKTTWQYPGLPAFQIDDWTQTADPADPAAPTDRPAIRTFDQEHHAAQCAVAGQGLAVISDILANDLQAMGLLRQFRTDMELPGFTYHVLCLPERRRVRKIARFVEWLERSAPAPGQEPR